MATAKGVDVHCYPPIAQGLSQQPKAASKIGPTSFWVKFWPKEDGQELAAVSFSGGRQVDE